MNGNLCLITGANTGIGKVAARRLAEMGANVVMVCRNRHKGEAALQEIKTTSGNQHIELMIADLSSQAEIHKLADQFKAKYHRLDVLLNNAGVYIPKRTLTVDGLETTFAVNHLAYFLLTNLLLEVLQQSAPSRIVNVSSAAHQYGKVEFDNLQGERLYKGIPAYSNSKLENILFTRELARRLAGTPVTANALHPGAVATGIFRNTLKPIEWLIKLFTMSPEKGALTSVYLATSQEVAGITGKYFEKQQEKAPSHAAQDDETARRLWQVSEQLTGLNS
ncbi:MAG: SDR family oxidoreductase [Acidobacteria bacterium]|nr:SDR family oxidoreductase [Acidobacteriota bacterium]